MTAAGFFFAAIDRNAIRRKNSDFMWRQWVRERVADPTETAIRKRTLVVVVIDAALGLALFAAVNATSHFALRRWHTQEAKP